MMNVFELFPVPISPVWVGIVTEEDFESAAWTKFIDGCNKQQNMTIKNAKQIVVFFILITFWLGNHFKCLIIWEVKTYIKLSENIIIQKGLVGR